MDDSLSLLPCPNPWCASHDRADLEIFAAHQPIVMPGRKGDRWAVACPVCPLQTPYVATEAEAHKAWNTRIAAQSDRDAAGELWESLSLDEPNPNDGYAAQVLETMARAFARHRTAASSDQDGWRDIASAPRDGTVVLAYFPLVGLHDSWCRVVPVYWSECGEWIFASRAASGFSKAFEPTHWRPLPTPPEGSVS